MILAWLAYLLIFVILTPCLGIIYIMYKNRALIAIPGPPPVPFFGNKIPSNVQEIYDLIANNVKNYGETSRIYLGPMIRILTAEKEIIEYIMNSNVHLKKSLLYDMIKEWIGDGLLILKGDKWRRRRKLLTPTFHFGILNDFAPIMNNGSKLLVKKLSEQAGQLSVNVLNFTQQYSLDIIAGIINTSMNVELRCLEQGNDEYLNACNNFLELNIERSTNIWQFIPFVYKMSQNAKKVKEAVRVLHKVSKSIIMEKYAKEKNSIASTDNELGIKKKETLIHKLFNSRIQENLSACDIQSEIDTFMFEGFDTVSRALAFALYDLGQNAEVQNRLYEEIVSTFGDNDENLTQKQINELSYLDQVVKEVLRMHSSVPFIERELEDDATIGQRFFPKGTVFVILLHWLNWNRKYHLDPERFDPERFCPENSKHIPNFSYIPFSAGPRNCIGKKFALLELKLAILHVIKNLEILPVPGHKLNLVYNSLLDSTTGILIRIRRRN